MLKASDPTKGVILVMGVTLMFALADTATKHLTTLYPVSIVVLVRYMVNVALLLLILYPRQGAAMWRTRRNLLVTVRGLHLCGGSLTMGMALRVMPVGESVAIVYPAPFAAPILGERVSPIGWTGASLRFLGVLLIVRPGGALDPWGVTLCLINVGFSTAYSLMTRLLSRTETTNALLSNTAIIGSWSLGSCPGMNGRAHCRRSPTWG